MSDLQEKLAEFHKHMEIEHHGKWRMQDSSIIGRGLALAAEASDIEDEGFDLHYGPGRLRCHLIMEELAEFMTAKDEVEAADGLTDLLYVVIGTFVAYGWPMEELFNEVHHSNMTKQPNTGPRLRQKGDNFQAPDIKRVLEER